MDYCRLENAQGVFLPNDKAAGFSGGLLVHRESFVVSRFGRQMLTHLPLNVKPGGRDGLPCGQPLPRWGQRTSRKSEKRGCQKIRPFDRCIQHPTPTA